MSHYLFLSLPLYCDTKSQGTNGEKSLASPETLDKFKNASIRQALQKGKDLSEERTRHDTQISVEFLISLFRNLVSIVTKYNIPLGASSIQ